MSKLTKEQLETMSVEDILNLNSETVGKLQGFVIPQGLYTGTVTGWEMPSEDNNESFEPTIQVTGVIELEDSEAEYEVTDESKASVRYSRKFITAIESMNTTWEEFFTKIGGGNLGAAMAQGDGTAVNFRVEHRYIYKDKDTGEKLPKPRGPFMDIKDVVVL